mmetsp:Transcript_12710/g.17126  ORF Transcript_12710/g.17126 Transcript_12710/m.17126 type:complete len:142 (-) Transcript_12710:81-506(-)
MPKHENFEAAARHIQKTGLSVRQAAKKFSLNRKTLSSYLAEGHKPRGKPPILSKENQDKMSLFLLSVESSTNTQFTRREIGEYISRFGGKEGGKPIGQRTIGRYLNKTDLKLTKVHAADRGRIQAMDDPERFSRSGRNVLS